MVDDVGEVVHTVYVPNTPEAIQAQFKYLSAVEEAFYRIGAEIAKAECRCDEAWEHCPRCQLVKTFAGQRRVLSKLKQENKDHG